MKYCIDDEEREVTIITMGKNDTVDDLIAAFEGREEYKVIVMSNPYLEGEYDDILDEMHALLEFHVSTYLDNQLDFWVSSKHRSGRPLRGVYQFCSPEDTTRDFMSWRPQKRKELQRLLERIDSEPSDPSSIQRD